MQRQPSYEQLATLVVEQAAVIESLQTRVAVLQTEVVSLRRQVRRDSSNSSQPPSQNGPAAEAEDQTRTRDRDGDGDGGRSGPRRRQGGQKGHPGKGLERVVVPDRREPVEPHECGGCGAGLTGAPGRVASSVQVFDLPTFAVTVTEYLMMRRTCSGCGHATTAAAPRQVTGAPACYGPNVVAATTFLASQDVIGIERPRT